MQVSKARTLVLDEAVYRFLPLTHEEGYADAHEKMRCLVKILTAYENKWIKGPEDDMAVTACSVTTTWMKQFVCAWPSRTRM